MQEQLGERFTLILPWRRGYGDSPPAEQQDFEVGRGRHPGAARTPLGPRGGLLLRGPRPARGRRAAPQMFLSLTLIEPPVFMLAGDDPAVQELLGQLGQLVQAGPAGAPRPS